MNRGPINNAVDLIDAWAVMGEEERNALYWDVIKCDRVVKILVFAILSVAMVSAVWTAASHDLNIIVFGLGIVAGLSVTLVLRMRGQ